MASRYGGPEVEDGMGWGGLVPTKEERAAEQQEQRRKAELAALRARAEKAEQFREAVIDALVVACIYVEEHDSNPRKAINDLICWEQQIALDPLVSSDARALIERAVAGCAEDCAIQVAAREKAEKELSEERTTKYWVIKSNYELLKEKREAEQENARLREALAWRPIETAPHHDWILLDCGNAGIVEGCYSTFKKEDAPRWFDSYGRTIYGPLHWIPLLDMPAARTALGGE